MNRFIIAAVVVVALAGSMSPAAVTDRDIYKVLEDRGIPFDAAAVQKASVGAMVTAVDARARIFPAGEVTNSAARPVLEKIEEWPEGLCYVKFSGLYAGTGTAVVEQVRGWVEARRSGLILDLRGAAGDHLGSVDELAGLFIDQPEDLYVVKDGRGRVLETHASVKQVATVRGLPVLLAVDSGTSEASEALAMVLKGRPRVMLIGGATRGDPALREMIPLSSNEVVRMATRWIEPMSGKAATHSVVPDVTVSGYTLTALPPDKAPLGRKLSEKSKKDRELMQRVYGDAVLGSATDILLGLKALGVHASATNTPSSEAR